MVTRGSDRPQMRTNLCRFTVSFSGLSWDSVDLGPQGNPSPMYPRGWQVNAYLQHFYRLYIPKHVVRFRTRVELAEIVTSHTQHAKMQKWKITTSSTGGGETVSETLIFDFLVIASGQFSQPCVPNHFVTAEDFWRTSVPIIHSVQYRTVGEIPKLNDIWDPGNKVLVVVGSHFEADVATGVALQMSELSDEGSLPTGKVVHISSRKMFALPSLLRTSNPTSCEFQPADFKLYNRSNLPAEPAPCFTYGLFKTEKHSATFKMVHSLTAGEDSISNEEKTRELQINAVISDSYLQFVDSGTIQPAEGMLQELKLSSDPNRLTATIETHSGDRYNIPGVVVVVYATGFNAAGSLSFLSEDVKSLMGFNPHCTQLPLVLDTSYSSQNMAVPNLAVLGFAAQYWGVVEMQARAVTEAWTNDRFLPSPEQRETLARYWVQLRDATLGRQKSTLPPNPFADYVGLMEQASRELGLRRIDGDWSSTEGPICPARYIEETANEEETIEANTTTKNLHKAMFAVTDSKKYIAKAVFNGLLGEWVPWDGLAEANSKTTDWGLTIQPRRTSDPSIWQYLALMDTASGRERHVFQYDEATDQITTWNVVEGIVPVHSKLNFMRPELTDEKDVVIAQSTCTTSTSKDFETLIYRFHFSGASLTQICMEKQNHNTDGKADTVWIRRRVRD